MKRKYELAREIGQRIKAHRESMGISQTELGLRCNKDAQSVEIVENGKTNPTIYTLYILCHALGIDLKRLFLMEGKEGEERDLIS